MLAEPKEGCLSRGSCQPQVDPQQPPQPLLADGPCNRLLTRWKQGPRPPPPPSLSPPSHLLDEGAPSTPVVSRAARGLSSRRREKRGAGKAQDLLRGLPPSFPKCRAERKEASVQLGNTFTNSVWNFPSHLLSPPAPSIQPHRPCQERLSAWNGRGRAGSSRRHCTSAH